jgi:hypothetical protein
MRNPEEILKRIQHENFLAYWQKKIPKDYKILSFLGTKLVNIENKEGNHITLTKSHFDLFEEMHKQRKKTPKLRALESKYLEYFSQLGV